MNLAEIRNTIQAHGYSPDTTAAQNVLVNQIYREVLNHRRWPWLRRTAVLPLSAGSTALDLSTLVNLRDVDAIHLGGLQDPLALDLEDLRSQRPVFTANGCPRAWARFGSSLEILPAADRDYDVTVDYIYSPPPLVDDADVPVIPAEHHDILVYGAISRLGIRERDTNVRQLLREDYISALAALRSAAGFEQRQTSRQVGQSGIYDQAAYGKGWFW